MIIKALLIAALASACFFLVHSRPTALNLLVRRAGALLVLVVGTVAVIWPSSTTSLAHAVGVGRGTDLLLYLLCVTFLFTTIGMHLRLAQLQDRHVELSRQIAIQNAVLSQSEGQTQPLQT